MECMLCAEVSEYFGLPECEHKEVCSLCWYRLTIQLKTNSCPVCRNKCETIFIVSDPNFVYLNLSASSWGESYQGFTRDSHSGLYFESKHEMARLSSFKKLFCRICREELRNITEYKKHAKEKHTKLLCEQCMQSSKLFPAEQEVFDESELMSHRTSFHKKCNVCCNYFYDANTLVAHIKNSHYFCEFCPFEQRVAYLNVQNLEEHYKDKHFYCEMLGCKEARCFVFKKYEDFQEHFRQIHPACNIPKPKLAFRLNDEDRKCVFEDNQSKGPVNRPKIENSIEFPALAPSANTQKVLDYSKVISKPPSQVRFEHVPQAMKKNSSEVKRPKEQFREEFKIEVPGLRKNSPVLTKFDLIEKNISKLNNSHMTKEEFLLFIRSENILVDNDLKRKIRDKVWSNSDKEDIIFKLENPNHKKPPEEFKNQPVKRPLEVVKSDELTDEITQTLFENLILLNSGLIDPKDYVNSMKHFVSFADVDKALKLIKDNLGNQSLFQEILEWVQRLYKNPKPQSHVKPKLSNNPYQEKPVISQPKSVSMPVSDFPVLKSAKFAEIEETLIENLSLYKSEIISLTDFVDSCKQIVPVSEKDSAYSLIRQRIPNSKEVIEKLDKIYQNKIGFCEIKVGHEPNYNRRSRPYGRQRARRGK